MTSFGSAASGIEAASVAWNPLGWRAAWLSEIDPFASGVLAYRHPEVPNLGDMTRLPEWILSGVITAPDVFVAGTPCQAFSIAGLRKSLEDARGNLSLTYCEIVNAIDTARAERNEEPCTAVWENVPGVLSTKDNAFGCFLAGLAGEDVPLVAAGGKWPDAGLVVGPARAVAWRVLDAQFFGVAQRRRRVFVVASARDGFDPGAVLFEFDGVRRDTPPVRETREDPTSTLTEGARKRGGYSTDDVPLTPEWPAQIACTLNASFGSKQGLEDQHIRGGHPSLCPPMTMAHGQGGAEIAEDRAPTLTCNHEAPILFLGGRFDEVAHTLRGEGFDASEDGTGRGTPLIPVPFRKVRRLTPRECERLQGFPDDYTRIPWKPYQSWTKRQSKGLFESFDAFLRKLPATTEDCPDGPRYKALGNSMAVPVMEWIGARIVMHLEGVI